MGYSKYLDGVRPTSLEGKVVSDADMLDLGANGIIRTLEYGFVKGRPVFDVNALPVAYKLKKSIKIHRCLQLIYLLTEFCQLKI